MDCPTLIQNCQYYYTLLHLGDCLHLLYIEKKRFMQKDKMNKAIINNKVEKSYIKEIGKELNKKLNGQTFFH